MFNHIFEAAPLTPKRRVAYSVDCAFNGGPFGWSQHRKLYKGGNVFEDIGNSVESFISDPISYTGDRLAEVDKQIIQPVYREVIQPVGHALEKVGQGIAKDPVTFLAQVAAVVAAPFTAGQSLWLLPVIAAASTAAHGGSLEQILTNTAISAASVWVGGNVGSYIMDGLSVATDIGPSFAVAGSPISFSTAQTIAQIGTGSAMAAVSAGGALAQGRDPLTAAIPALVGTAAGATINTLSQTQMFQDLGSSLNSVGANISPVVQKALSSVAGAAITGAVLGKDATGAIVGGVATGVMEGLYSTVDFVGNMFKSDAGGISKTGQATQGLLTNLIATVAANAAQSGPIGDQFSAKLQSSIAGTLGTYLNSAYDSLATQVQDLYTGATSTADRMNNAAKSQNDITNRYNNSVAEYQAKQSDLNNLYAQQDDLVARYNAATTQADVNSLKAQIDGVQANIRSHIVDLNAMNADFAVMQGQYDAAVNETTAAQNKYFELVKELGTKSELLTSKTNEIAKAMNQDLVKLVDPTFNESEYKTINNLGSGVDAYSHFMSVGKDQGLPTNVAAAQQEITDTYGTLAQKIAEKQGWPQGVAIPASMMKDLSSKLYSQYGNNLTQLKDASPDNITTQYGALGKTLDSYMPKYDSEAAKAAQNKLLIDKALTPGWYQPTDFKMPTGMKFASQQDIAEMMAEGKPIAQATDSNGYTVYLKQDPNYKPIQKYDAATGEIQPTASVLNDMVTLQNMPASQRVKFLATMSQQTSDYLAKTAPEIAQTAGYAKTIYDAVTSDSTPTFVKSLVSSFMGAAGSVIKNNALPLGQIAEYVGLTSVSNTSSDVYKWGQALEKAANALTPAEYQDSMKQAQGIIDSAKGFWGTLGAFKDVAGEYAAPVAATVIAKELFEEGFQYVPERMGYAAAGTLAAALGVTGLPALAVAAGGGISVAVLQNMAESYTGGYENTLNKLIEAGMKEGLTREQAAIKAEPFAREAGLTDSSITAVLEGVAKNTLIKTMFKATPDAAQDALIDKFITAVKVGATESGKEGFENMLQSVSDGSIVNRVYAGTVELPKEAAQGLAWGTIVGGPVGGTMSFATSGAASTVLSDLATFSNNTINQKINDFRTGSVSLGELGTTFNQWLPAGNDVLKNSVVSQVLESTPTAAANYADAGAYMDAVKNAFGVWNTTAADIADATPKFSNQVTSTQESIKILEDKGLTNVTVEDVASANIAGVQTKDQGAKADAYVNQNMVSLAELQAAAAQENYTYTQAELDKLVGRGVQANVIAQFISEIDPKAVTTAEAKQYFVDRGYTNATADEIAQFVKSAPETEVQQAVETYVDPRQVTRDEAVQFYKDLNYTPTEAEIQQFIKHGKDIQEAQVKSDLGGYVDPRMVDSQEVKDMLTSMGLIVPASDADVARLTGQYAELELSGKTKEALPVIAANATYAQQQAAKESILNQMEAYEKANIDRDTALDLAISGVAQDLGVAKSELLAQLGLTEANLKADIQNVQQLVGRPNQQVSAADATAIQGMIAGTTPVNLAYDTNQDGKVDQSDLTNVQTQLDIQQGTNVETTVDPTTGLTVYTRKDTGKPIDVSQLQGTQWAPSGIYSVLEQQKAQQAATAKAQAATAKQATQKNQFGQLMSLLFQAPDAAGQQVTVKTPDPSKINYIYDFSSIFANPAQASLMPSPYGPTNTLMPQQPQQKQQAANQPLFQFASGFAEGGIVGGNDIEVGDGGSVDDLINILKGNSG